MNHVAHCLLSHPDPDVLLGNFIGDFVKGHDWQLYPPEVQRGILLHRRIDGFTDAHPAVRDSIQRIRPFAGRFAGPVTDILYDHLLIKNWETASDVAFDPFALWVYDSLNDRSEAMPELLQQRWPRMRAGQFLHGYRHREGMEWVMDRFSARLAGVFEPKALTAYFFEHLDDFSVDFKAFYPDLKAHVLDFQDR